MDVDGVLTDGSFIWGPAGDEYKRFSFADVMGLSRARKAGLHLGLISGENSPLIDRFAEKVGIVSVTKDCKDKAMALRNVAQAFGTHLDRVAFIGDDINDLPALELAGFSAAPADAQPIVRERVHLTLSRGGGGGAVRELVELILSVRQSPIGPT